MTVTLLCGSTHGSTLTAGYWGSPCSPRASTGFPLLLLLLLMWLWQEQSTVHRQRAEQLLHSVSQRRQSAVRYRLPTDTFTMVLCCCHLLLASLMSVLAVIYTSVVTVYRWRVLRKVRVNLSFVSSFLGFCRKQSPSSKCGSWQCVTWTFRYRCSRTHVRFQV